MRPIFIPDLAKARSALCAPGPGVFVLVPPVARNLTCKALTPSSLQLNTIEIKIFEVQNLLNFNN